MRRFCQIIIFISILQNVIPVNAHHSFAVHFVSDEIVSVSGTVSEFRFTNPHGLVYLKVKSEDGEEQLWRAETNSPNVLRRRGWSNNSIRAGDRVTIEGYPARDGSNSLRIYRVVFPDGKELPGQGRVLADPPGKE